MKPLHCSTKTAIFLSWFLSGYTLQTIGFKKTCLSALYRRKYAFDKIRGYTINQKSNMQGIVSQKCSLSNQIKQFVLFIYKKTKKPSVTGLFWQCGCLSNKKHAFGQFVIIRILLFLNLFCHKIKNHTLKDVILVLSKYQCHQLPIITYKFGAADRT